jgi:tetratricopeptide (TPR) repeat protein
MFIQTLVMASLSLAATGSAAGILERAEKEFREAVQGREQRDEARKHFQTAAELYEALRRQGVNNADLYGNLGNAALLADNLPAAILAYQRGLRQDPGDRALHDNLEYARDQVAYPVGVPSRPAPDPWPPWLPRPADDLLLALALVLYGLGCVSATRWLMTRRSGLVMRSAVALVLGGVLGLWWGSRQWQHDEDREHQLVVMAADTTPLRTGNGRSYPVHKAMPVVNRGMEGRLLFARGDWLQLEFPGGEVGWVPRGSVLVDE